MAEQRQLDWLKRGETYWNQWRHEQPDLRPDLTEAYLNSVDLSSMDLSRADLSHADLTQADLWQTNLWGANLASSILMKANLTQATLTHATLHRAALYKATLHGANLSGADLSEANLNRADLSGADLSGANLSGATLTHANLNGATCRETDFSNTRIGWTLLGDLDLSAAKGLETVQHQGPSIIGIETIYRSNGNIAEHFLRQAGVPETFLTYMHSLVAHAIDYYTCFLLYAAEDYPFVKRLHADLQSEGVRCWQVPYDQASGNETHAGIDESIRLYDKLLLVLSSNSIERAEVRQEAERLLAKEQEEQRLIIVPLSIDRSAQEQASSWLDALRTTRPIEDFSRWKRYDAYLASFYRLLEALKSGNVQRLDRIL